MKPQERRLFFDGILLMSLVRVALWICPIQRIMRRLERMEKKRVAPGVLPGITAQRAARRLRQAAGFCPVPITCLAQALAAKTLMARYGYAGTLRIGVLKSDARLQAHAWLECSDGVLIGNPMPSGKEYVPLAGAERLAG